MENGGEVLLAPNGKPSNLTPEQYKLVRTPAFKAWFGDWENAYETGNYDNVSKVIDEKTKEPLVVYHGSPYKFNIFTTKEEPRFFFTDNLALANHFADYLEDDEGNIIDGKIYQVFLNLKNPKINKKADSNSNETINQAYEIYEDLVDKYEYGEIEENILLESSEGAILFYENWYSVGATNLTNYVVFNSNQIKLADGTNTTFDANNPDIRYADGGELNMNNEIKERLFWIEYLNELIENEKKYAIQTLYFSKATGDEIYQYISFLSPDGNYKKPSVISKLNKTAIGTLSQVNDVYKNFSLDKLGFKIIKIENEKMEKGGGISEQKYFKVIKNTKPIFAVKIAEGEENISGMSELVMDRLTDYGYFLNEISKSDYENFDYSKIDADDITAFLGILDYFNTENYEAKFNAHKIPSREIFTLAMEVRNTYPKLWFKRGSEYGNQAFKDLIKVMKRGYWLDTEQEIYKKRKEYIDAHKEDVDLDDVISMLKWMGEVRGGYDYMLNVIQKKCLIY